MKNILFRQGDVLLEKIKSIPQKSKKRDIKTEKDHLLVTGELSNHGHFITGNVEVYENESEDEPVNIYIQAIEGASLQHLNINTMKWTKEHESIDVPEGKYKVIRQIEFNPYPVKTTGKKKRTFVFVAD